MGGHPVEDYAYPGLMTFVYKSHKIPGISIAARYSKITRHLISPGAIVGMLGNGHQLYMGVTHFLDVWYKLL